MTRISSAKYLAGSRGQPCTLRIPGHCIGGTETTVPAHIRDRHTGNAQKASDISVANACFGCHTALDQNLIPREDWLFFALRGLQETLEQRHEAGLLIVPLDAPKAPKPVQRKPKSERKSIPHNPERKIRSRPFPKRSKDHA